MKKIILFSISVCLSLLVGCSPNEATPIKEDVPKFIVTSPVVVDTAFNQEYVADIQAIQNVEVRARVGGFVEKIHADEGGDVQAGQLLFSISNRELQEELLKAKAQLKNIEAEIKVANVELNNTQTLVEKNIIAASELEMKKAKLEALQAQRDGAKSAVSSAQLKISFTQVKAPFCGSINRIPLKVGSLVEESALLTTISNTKEVFAYFNVSEKEYLQRQKEAKNQTQQTASLVLADGQLFDHKGKIETVESEINKATGNLAFRARFPNAKKLLKHGASGKILLAKKLNKAMIIPQKSAFEIQENNYVFVIDKNNTVQMRRIEIQQRIPQLYVIDSGLSPDDRLLYEGIQLVKEGDKIAPQMQSMKMLMSQLAKQ